MGKTVCFGEIMMRLKAPGFQRLLQTPELEASFGGAEANVAVALALWGGQTEFVTSLPPGPLGDAAIACLRGLGVGTGRIKRGPGRMGLYFLENGSNHRPAQVVYDRQFSSVSLAEPAIWDWRALLGGASRLHISGITPALSAHCAEACRTAAAMAREMGLGLSLDLNYRSKLWQWGKPATEVMPGLCAQATQLFANEEDIQKCLGIGSGGPVTAGPLDPSEYKALCQSVLDAYPNLAMVAVTLRENQSADRNRWTAVLQTRTGFLAARSYDLLDIVDRVGAGDAFVAGFMHGQDQGWDPAACLEFATAAGCLKHSVPGDFNLVSSQEVATLVAGSGQGRISR